MEVTPHSPPSAVQGSQAVRSVISRLRRRIRAASAADDLTQAQAAVLARLTAGEGLSTSDLAAAEGVRHQSMASTVTALTGLGLVERRPDPSDGRRLLIALTPGGRHRAEEDRQARGEWLAGRLRDRCTEEERQTVLAAMAVLERLTHD
ncbi:MarR family winged helix-turn-helix transcriptional regulator [Streptomyces sp. NPDC048182]|uniref:MarR family winged helix-turn-helix transcriptional regulator n=1 Tax=Streptomyces sp. NPDC048182 TaxID=3365507 RepID=UPI00371D8B41